MRKIKGILFDKDGVLVDFDKTWVSVLLALARQLANSDRHLEKILLRSAGYDSDKNEFLPGSVWGAGNTNDLVAIWKTHLSDHSQSQLTQHIDTNCLNVEPVALFDLNRLQNLFSWCRQQNMQLGIATNDVQLSAVNTMKQFGLHNDLSIIIGYDSVDNPKPAADPVLLFCEHCEVQSQEVLVVGDNVHDLQMANAGNVALKVGVLSGNSKYQDLKPYADVILENVLELPDLLRMHDPRILS